MFTSKTWVSNDNHQGTPITCRKSHYRNSMTVVTKSVLEVNDHELRVRSVSKAVCLSSTKYRCGADTEYVGNGFNQSVA